MTSPPKPSPASPTATLLTRLIDAPAEKLYRC